MTSPVAGIDPHQDNFTVGIVDLHGVAVIHQAFDNTATGFVEAMDLLSTHSVHLVGIEGSAKWGAHVAIALAATGFDTREVPPQRTAAQRRSRRLDKTDAVDAISAARAVLAEPTLGPAQALELYDPLVAKIEAVLEHRRALVETRTLMLAYVADQITKLPTEIRDQLTSVGKIESRLRRLEDIDMNVELTDAGRYRLSWLMPLIDQDRLARSEIRRLERLIDDLLNEHGTTLRDEAGVGTIAAATLLCEVGDPSRFATEAKFARWCGVGAVALSSGEGTEQPNNHRLDFGGNRRINSVLYMASITQARCHPEARQYLDRKTSEGKTRRSARRAHKRHLANRVIRRMWRDQHTQISRQTTIA
ncbi:MAG: IS110 family transposase [bacterium]|nr:IS110 family transposase [bacterium]